MNVFEAIASMQPNHFVQALATPSIALLPETGQRRIEADLRHDRARVLMILGQLDQPIDSLVLQGVAQGWDAGELVVRMRQRSVAGLQAAARGTRAVDYDALRATRRSAGPQNRDEAGSEALREKSPR